MTITVLRYTPACSLWPLVHHPWRTLFSLVLLLSLSSNAPSTFLTDGAIFKPRKLVTRLSMSFWSSTSRLRMQLL
ncbi:uncharacterized protein HD556DRAFT_1319524 [Suillus plorans]|uniref:Secreted protein n=1 Tax=Suillus plorans TaxID=116603 RepID=A0A9P7E484_9AGAM|nr:uncharacterized protein HD556DRAFT_1319524 [Suillus plorans]KAG1810338.1 hypothetical protein HD556DRAFT_1319524 [Suillus plorans]